MQRSRATSARIASDQARRRYTPCCSHQPLLQYCHSKSTRTTRTTSLHISTRTTARLLSSAHNYTDGHHGLSPDAGPPPDKTQSAQSLITYNFYFGGSADIPSAALTNLPARIPLGLVPLALRPHLSMGLLLSVVAFRFQLSYALYTQGLVLGEIPENAGNRGKGIGNSGGGWRIDSPGNLFLGLSGGIPGLLPLFQLLQCL
jgi:hypothetical protein